MKKNRFISLLLCVCMVMSLFVGLTGPAGADDGDVIDYTVKDGDYLFKICQRHGLNYYQVKGAIMTLNGFSSEQQLNKISVGQHIQLPATNAVAATVKSSTVTTTTVKTSTTVGGTTTTTTTTSTLTGDLGNYTVAYYLVPVTVKNGDTLNSLCNDLGTSYYNYANVILRVNGLGGPNSLKAGSTIYLPTTKPFTSGSGYAVIAHSVATGENVTKICEGYELNYQAATTKSLVDGVNPNKNLNKIWSGDVIYIPKPVQAVTTAVSTGSGSGSSSGSASVATGKYQISVDTAENGNPYVVVGSASYATRADAGKSVIIMTNPKDGYAVKGIKVIRADSGSNVPVTNNSFTMPESNVKVAVTYAKGLSINKQTSAHGTFDALVYGIATNSAFYGDEVIVDTKPNAGYSVKSVRYEKATDKTLGSVVEAEKGTGIYKFKMPNYNIKLFVEYEFTPYRDLKAIITGVGTVTFTVDGVAVQKAEKGKTVQMTITPASGWVLEEQFETKYIKGTAFDGTPPKDRKTVDTYNYTFVVGDDPVKVRVILDNMNAFSLICGDYSYGYVAFNVMDVKTGKVRADTTWARKGDTVEISALPYNGYVYDAVATKGYTTIASTGALLPSTAWTGNYKFTMPESDIRVIPQFKESTGKEYYLISAYATDYGSIVLRDKATGNVVYESEDAKTIQVCITPISNYTVDYVWYTDVTGDWNKTGAIKTSSDPIVYEFTMPKSSCVVYVGFKLKYDAVKVSVNADSGVKTEPYYLDGITEQLHMFVNSQHIKADTEVIVNNIIYFYFHLEDNKVVNEVWKTGGSGKDVLLHPTGDGGYTYQVTEEDYIAYKNDSSKNIIFKVTTKAAEVKTYMVQYSDPLNGNRYTLNGVSGNIQAQEADTITLEIIPATGYEFAQVIVDGITISGADITPATEASYAKYSFKMPAHDVKTQVTFKETESSETPNPKAINYGPEANFKWAEDRPVKASVGSTVTVKITTDKYLLKEVTGVTGGTLSGSAGNYTYTFTMPDMDVTLTATAVKPTITLVYPASLITPDGSNPADAEIGTVVTMKWAKGANVDVISVTGVSGTVNAEKTEITFTMPAENTEITVTAKKWHEIIFNAFGPSEAVGGASGDNYGYEGESFTKVFSPASGHRIKSLKLNGTELAPTGYEVDQSATITETMGTSNAVFDVTFE